MENFNIGDKVVFKKEVLDAISKTDCVKSHMGNSLSKEYYNYLIKTSDFEKLGYFNVKEVHSCNILVGLYIGIDLFEHYQEKCTCKISSDLTTTKNYQNNEIKFQRAKASCKRGTVPAGSTISGRKDKIAISIGHLSYQVCNC